MSAIDVARKYGITRQRVAQIMQEPPSSGVSVKKYYPTLEQVGFVRFPQQRTKHLNNPEIQAQIRSAMLEPGTSTASVAQQFGCTFHAVQRIVQMHSDNPKKGRPLRRRTPEELAARQRIHAKHAARNVRDQAIMLDRQTVTIIEISRKYGLSCNMVCSVLRRMPPNLTRFDGRVR